MRKREKEKNRVRENVEKTWIFQSPFKNEVFNKIFKNKNLKNQIITLGNFEALVLLSNSPSCQ